jgi:hypothetical protein
MTGQPAPEQVGFAALIAAAQAIEQQRPDCLELLLRDASLEGLLRAGARHRCLGFLRRGVMSLGVRTAEARALLSSLRAYAGKAAVLAHAVRPQLASLVSALSAAGVRYVLLKGAARLFRGRQEADDDTMYDLDVLVARADAGRAWEILRAAGYRPAGGEVEERRYTLRHHHLAPLQPPGVGLPVELHLQLAPRLMLSLSTDYEACQPYLERVVDGSLTAPCLNDVGTVLHLAIHGAGVHRLYDVIQIARAVRDGEVYTRAWQVLSSERRQQAAVLAPLVLGARLAGRDVPCPPRVERYLAWVMRREALPPYVRDRSQVMDAWFCNGGRLLGPALWTALPLVEPPPRNPLAYAGIYIYRLAGRLATAAWIGMHMRMAGDVP